MKLAELKKRVKMVRLKRLAMRLRVLEGQMKPKSTSVASSFSLPLDDTGRALAAALAEVERLRAALTDLVERACDNYRCYCTDGKCEICLDHVASIKRARAALAGQPQPAEAPGLVRCPEAGHAPCICNDCEHAREHRHVPGCDDSERHDLAGCPACVPVKEG